MVTYINKYCLECEKETVFQIFNSMVGEIHTCMGCHYWEIIEKDLVRATSNED